VTGSAGGEPVFEVADGGLLSTVQDAGRPDWTHLGVPESGAADPFSLAVANLLVGNDPGAAALELSLVGPTLVARSAVTVGLAGADLGARLRGGRRLVPGRSHRLAAGDVVEMPGIGGSAARAYLAVPGGIAVPMVLGSRSTCLAGVFGGLAGRPLRAGDWIGAASSPVRGETTRDDLVWPEPDPDPGRDRVLRLLPGPAPGIDELLDREWRVGASADRVGIRLEGDPLPTGIGGETLTHGVPWGAVQVPAGGIPIVLGPDHQTTGGYRVVAVVISADRPVIGQLRPGSPVRLAAVDRAAAVDALHAREAALRAGIAALRDAAGWGELIDTAGG
jgi:antagonist of KipI